MSTDTAFALGVLALVAPRRDAPARSPADARGDRRPRGAAGDRDRLHGGGRRRRARRGGRPVRACCWRCATRRWPGVRRPPRSWGWAFGSRCTSRASTRCSPGWRSGSPSAPTRPARTDLERVTELTRSFREQPTPELARSAQLGVTSAISANERLQYRLHPWTSFVIVPLFALANVGIHVDGELLGDAVTLADHARDPVRLRGRQAGRARRRDLARDAAWVTGLRPSLSWPVIVGGGAVAGIPFTVSLLIAGIAFEGQAARGGEARRARAPRSWRRC